MSSTIPLKAKPIVRIGNSRGIIIDAAFFANGILDENAIVDVEITVAGKSA